MSRDHLLNSDPKKVWNFSLAGGRIVSRRPFFFVFGRFFVFLLIPITTLEKKVELLSRARILKPNIGAERETERKKERRRRKASIHPFYAGDRVRLPPSRLRI